jgi:phosphatidylglycerophosphate synthase
MASPIDVGIIEQFSSIFVVLFVWIFIYAALTMSKVLGDKNYVAHIVGIIIGLLTLISPNIVEVIKIMIPWTVIILVFVMLVVLVLLFMSTTGGSAGGTMELGNRAKRIIAFWMLAIMVIIFFGAVGKVYFGDGEFIAEDQLAGTAESGERSFWLTIFHPKVLGFILVMLIAVFTISIIGGKTD